MQNSKGKFQLRLVYYGKLQVGACWFSIILWIFEIFYIPDIVIHSSFFQGSDHYSDLGLIIMQKLQKQHNCIPDEHYVQTLLSVSSIWFCFYPLLSSDLCPLLSSDLCLIAFFFSFSFLCLLLRWVDWRVNLKEGPWLILYGINLQQKWKIKAGILWRFPMQMQALGKSRK